MSTHRILRHTDLQTVAEQPFFEDGFFFNSPDHLRQQSQDDAHTVTALNRITGRTEARCTFFVEPNGAVSPAAAPFGSVEFIHTLPDAVLSDMLDAIIREAQTTGAPRLRLVNYPDCYAPEQARRLSEHLIGRGFRVTAADPSFFLPVTNNPFENTIDASERRRLRKCRQAGFQFLHECCPNVDEVLSFLLKTRRQQSYTLTLPIERLKHLLGSFPEQFSVFVVKDGPVIAALTVTVRVREDILYNFLPASNPDYHTYSPMVLLTDGLFSYCQRQQIRLLDLGVSLDGNQQPKPSLIRFKRNLGAQESPKLTFEKRF